MESLSKVFECFTCGTEVVRKRCDQKFCSTKCRNKYHKTNNQDYHTNWQRENGRKNREALNQIKLDKGCARCGYKGHPAALDFNHIDPTIKSFNIGESVTNLSLKRLLSEVVKCEVLCANCHRIHTYENHTTRLGTA